MSASCTMRYAVVCTALGGSSPVEPVVERRPRGRGPCAAPRAERGSASCGCGVSGAVRGGGLVAAQERQHPAHLVEAGRAERPDVRERLARALRLACRRGAARRRTARRSGSASARARRAARGRCGCAPPARLCGGARRAALGARCRARGARGCLRRSPKQSARPSVVIAMRNGCQPVPSNPLATMAASHAAPTEMSAHSRAPRTTAPMIANASAMNGGTGVGRHEQVGERERGDDRDGEARPAPRRRAGRERMPRPARR